MTIEVTQEDIDRGNTGCKRCPIALAMNRKTNGISSVYNNSCMIGGRFLILPKLAVQFVADFDAGKPVKPFRFKI